MNNLEVQELGNKVFDRLIKHLDAQLGEFSNDFDHTTKRVLFENIILGIINEKSTNRLKNLHDNIRKMNASVPKRYIGKRKLCRDAIPQELLKEFYFRKMKGETYKSIAKDYPWSSSTINKYVLIWEKENTLSLMQENSFNF